MDNPRDSGGLHGSRPTAIRRRTWKSGKLLPRRVLRRLEPERCGCRANPARGRTIPAASLQIRAGLCRAVRPGRHGRCCGRAPINQLRPRYDPNRRPLDPNRHPLDRTATHWTRTATCCSGSLRTTRLIRSRRGRFGRASADRPRAAPAYADRPCAAPVSANRPCAAQAAIRAGRERARAWSECTEGSAPRLDWTGSQQPSRSTGRGGRSGREWRGVDCR